MGGTWHIDWPLVAGLIVLTGLYLWALGPGRGRLGGPAAFPVGKASLFLSGLLSLGLAIMSPIGELADGYLFTMHMVQHLILTMLSAPLILAGIPAWVVRPLAEIRGVYPVLRWLTRPVIAFLTFNIAFNGWHVPQLYDLALRNGIVHIIEHQMMLGTALLLWCPSLCPLPELRSNYGIQILYYFINSIIPTILGAVLTFAEQPLYRTYELAPRIWGISALQDQQIGALIMWIPGGTIFLGALSVAFFKWMSHEDESGDMAVA